MPTMHNNLGSVERAASWVRGPWGSIVCERWAMERQFLCPRDCSSRGPETSRTPPARPRMAQPAEEGTDLFAQDRSRTASSPNSQATIAEARGSTVRVDIAAVTMAIFLRADFVATE